MAESSSNSRFGPAPGRWPGGGRLFAAGLQGKAARTGRTATPIEKAAVKRYFKEKQTAEGK